MRIRPSLSVIPVILLSFSSRVAGQSGWQIEAGAAVPLNIPLPLTIHQGSEPDIHLSAEYASEPFVPPICWVWRIGYWSDGRSWELEAMHHKLYLDNTSGEISVFSITHGLNLITVNRAWETGGYVLRVGAGVVLAHPENTIRGKVLKENGGIFNLGYYLTGPTFSAGVARQVTITDGFFFNCEARLGASYARVPVNGGDAHLYNCVVQVTLAAGWGEERGER